MRLNKLLLGGVMALAVGACQKDEFIDTPVQPAALVRFIHAVPDTGAMDFRFVDLVENSSGFGMLFRTLSISTSTGGTFYQRAAPGARHLRIFMDGLTAAVASTIVKDTTLNLVADKFYTVVLHGFARAGSTPALQLSVFEDGPTDPGTQVGLRVVNLGAGLGAQDVYVSAQGAAVALPATPTFSNVAYAAASAYAATAAGTYQYRTTAPASVTVVASGNALAGVAGTTIANPQPGTSIAGSAVSGFIVPRSVAGSGAPQAFTTPGVIFLWDRRPPSTSP
ncbi:MAG: DUF4397 domain-containing protein [Gemmatimonadales bacterium]|nr:DUF4397 domain-containing protein [Gemmatimonadales bacterium]